MVVEQIGINFIFGFYSGVSASSSSSEEDYISAAGLKGSNSDDCEGRN